MKTMPPDLVFPETGQPQGFSTLATSQWQGNPEPVVRELLQNCLDAAVAAKRQCAEIDFTIRNEQLDSIPGIDQYCEHFEDAARQRAQGKQGHAEVQVIAQIRQVLSSPEITVLSCRDNGIGLNHDRMGRLLTEGDTDKHDGAGAFGVGHLTAFAASTLRFVFYAGRYRDDDKSELSDVTSAHAILASRRVSDTRGRGGHGFWLTSPTLFDPKPCPNSAPPLLKKGLSWLEDTGSVVAILGFNGFRGTEPPAQAIARVAAKNFLVAIWSGNMDVRVHDERDDTNIVVDRSHLKSILVPGRNQTRAEQGGGYLSGEQAYRAWETLEHGKTVELEAGATARFRRLEYDGRRPTTRVQLFRNGMWITNKPPYLGPPDFGGHNPFDAVVMTGSGLLAGLVRGAEGPEHRGIEMGRLGGRDRKRLRDLLKGIAGRFRGQAGEIRGAEEYEPEGFALFQGDRIMVAEVAPPYHPRAGEDGNSEATTLVPDDDARTIDPPEPIKRKKKAARGARPKPGPRMRGRLTVRGNLGRDGTVTSLDTSWRPASTRRIAGSYQAVRVRIPSGSDETCEQPLPPDWLQISKLVINGEPSTEGHSKYEARLPWGAVDFTLHLHESTSFTDPSAVEVDIVRRRDQASNP
ncbi:MAG: hypothetical protein OXQ94_03895 [Gemmatimonadota bacterium]|nr:hypothetical protein [Gemmatimonadota bacterium]MDE2870817.1 hypothetical protein [Gemmatimonadota bacterium]